MYCTLYSTVLYLLLSIFCLLSEGEKVSAIAAELKCAESTVYYTLRRFRKNGSHENESGRGRKPELTSKDVKYHEIMSLRDRRKTVTQLTNEFNMGAIRQVSRQTVRKALLQSKMYGRVAAKKTFFTPSQH